MKYLFSTLLFLFVPMVSVTYATTFTFNSYHNARFNYKIDYPDFLIPQGESENGDGQHIKNKNTVLIVYGSYSPEAIDEAFKYAKNDLKNFKIKYTIKKKNYFIIRAENAEQSAYFKTIFICNENINMRLYYPREDEGKWRPLSNRISQSFKYASVKCR